MINKKIVVNEGFAGLYTKEVNGEYDHVKMGLEKIEECDNNGRKYSRIDHINVSENYSTEERKQILNILWRGSQNDEEMQKITSLTADQYQQYVKGLNYVLNSEENIFDDIDVEKKFKE